MLFWMTACSSARVVSVEPGEGGQVALSSKNSDGAREKAMALMQDNCGSKTVKVIKEGEAVVGQNASSQTTAGRSLLGRPALNTSSRSTDRTEWRLDYKCQ
jgi:hypothetical protein